MKLIWGFVPSKALVIAIEADIFEHINSIEKTSAYNLSKTLGWKLEILESLLDLLSKVGMLNRSKQIYTLTKTCEKWFLKSSEQYLGSFVIRSMSLQNSYNDFINFSAHGNPVPIMHGKTMDAFGGDKEITTNFVQSMHAMSIEFANELEASIDFSSYNNILDIGAGKGTVSVAIALNNPKLYCDLIDLPGVTIHTRKYIDKMGISLRCRIYESDWNKWDWSCKYDCILLSQVLHEMQDKEAKNIISKCSKCLNKGGIIIVINTAPKDMINSILGSVFSLNMAVELGTSSPTISWVRNEFSLNNIKEKSIIPLSGARIAWIGEKA